MPKFNLNSLAGDSSTDDLTAEAGKARNKSKNFDKYNSQIKKLKSSSKKSPKIIVP